jgi:hypothetical protein
MHASNDDPKNKGNKRKTNRMKKEPHNSQLPLVSLDAIGKLLVARQRVRNSR